MKRYRSRISSFYIDNHGIVHKHVLEGVNVTAEDIDEDQELLLRLTKGKKAMVLVNATVFHTMTPESIERLKHHIAASRYATAMVSDKLGVRIFVDTISVMLKNDSPFRMFTKKEDAVKWLLQVKKDSGGKKPINRSAVSPRVHQKPIRKAWDVSLDKRGILTKKIYPGAHINLTEARNAEKKALKLASNKMVLALIDRRANYTITAGAIRYLTTNNKAKYRIATALVAQKSWTVVPSPKYHNKPVKVFTNKAAAVKYLLSLKKKYPGQ